MVARAYNAIEVDAKIISAFLIDMAALCQSKRHTAAEVTEFGLEINRYLDGEYMGAILHDVVPDEQRKLDILRFFPSPYFVELVEQFKGLAR